MSDIVPRHRRHATGFREACTSITQQVIEECPDLLIELWPDGSIADGEYLILNPHRDDHRLGSFRIRFIGEKAGCWRDFAVADKRAGGRDLVSLVAYYMGWSQGEALRSLRASLFRWQHGKKVLAISRTQYARSAP